MRTRFSPRTALVAAVGALALSLVNLSSASAAPGVVYLEHHGQVQTAQDPQANQCHRGPGPETLVRNQTEGTILIFPDGNCRTQAYQPVEPGEERFGDIGSFLALD
ncbi:hypothetical protein [Kitasatospora sp. NBC_01300]|uniref:hypothetical protein n=1 Tax=Kitasatospora sp. NBC_01300 TaxID=2903574 RepID=UPI002F916837|nr:hypothetical protein OG556_34860 [Kitasatospora sp. NBC_01300]